MLVKVLAPEKKLLSARRVDEAEEAQAAALACSTPVAVNWAQRVPEPDPAVRVRVLPEAPVKKRLVVEALVAKKEVVVA